MRRHKIKLLVCYLVATAAPAFAGPGSPLFDQGLAAFNNGQYLPAAEFFRQEILANRDDVLSHYYLGVAMHCLGRYPDATREYNWVLLNSQDPELIGRVQLGLKALAKLQAQGGLPPTAAAAGYTPIPGGPAMPPGQPAVPGAALPSGQATTAATGAPTAATTSNLKADRTSHPQAAVKPLMASAKPVTAKPPSVSAEAAKPAAAGSAKPFIGATGTYRIVDCSVEWSDYCKAFDPLFEEAKTKYSGTIRFDVVDPEAKNAKEFVQKYKIDAYPTLLFFDKSGKLLTRINGAPPTFDELDAHITSIFPGVSH